MDRKQYLKEYSRKWREKNRDKLRSDAREYYKNLPKERKKKYVEKNKRYRRRVRIKAIQHYGGKCACCGETHIEFLCFDHINNDGAKHRKQMPDRSIAPWLRRNKYPKGFRVLCHNCNMARGIYGYCPHEEVMPNDA